MDENQWKEEFTKGLEACKQAGKSAISYVNTQVDKLKEYYKSHPERQYKVEPSMRKSITAKADQIDTVIEDIENKQITIFWKDGTKSVSKCHSEEGYDFSIGLAIAMTRHDVGNLDKFAEKLRKEGKVAKK